MFRRSYLNMFHRSVVTRGPKSGVVGGEKTFKDKVKTEAIKMLKIQLGVVIVGGIVLFVFFPIPSVEEEKRQRLQYEQRARWKT